MPIWAAALFYLFLFLVFVLQVINIFYQMGALIRDCLYRRSNTARHGVDLIIGVLTLGIYCGTFFPYL